MSTPIDTIWYTRCPVPTASGIAIHNGWLSDEFRQDGIAVQSLSASTEQSVRESHFDHSVADSFRHGGNAPPIWSRSEGNDVVVVGMTWLPQYQSILAMPDSGIRTASDLRGRRLALPRRIGEKIDFWRASALQAYSQVLTTVGMTLDDVKLIDLPIHEPYIGNIAASSTGALFDVHQFASSARAETFAVIRGEADVLYNYGAAGPALQEFLGAHTVVDLNHHENQDVAINNGTPNLLTVSGRLVRERPELVTRYLAQVLRAAQWARDNRSAVQSIIAQEVSVAYDWVPHAFDASVYQNLEPSLSPALVRALEIRKNFLLEHGFIQKDFSIDDWVKHEPLAQAHEYLKRLS